MKLNYHQTPDNAQDNANFVILMPGTTDTVCSDFIFRPEDVPYNESPAQYHFQPWSSWCSAHFSSYYFFIQYKNARLRCKQFLYDLGPLSTLDHCALYDHWVWKMKPFVTDKGNIFWIGYDYSQSKTATFFSHGTNVELRLLEGELNEHDFKELCSTFTPIEKSSTILQKKFYELSYWSRHRDCLNNACINNDYKPPSSIWKLRWPSHNILGMSKPAIKNLPDYLHLDFNIDSQVTYGDKSHIGETQFILYPKDGRKNQIAWFRSFNKNSFSIKQPALSRLPELDSFSGFSQFHLTVLSPQNDIIASNIYVMSVHRDYGPHDAIWWDKENAYILQISAEENNSIEHFKIIFKQVAQ